MAYPNLRIFNEERVTAYSPSVGATPVSTYLNMPTKGYITKIAVTTQLAITTADATITVAVNGTTNANLAGTIPVSGAAAGQVATWVPLTATFVNEDDVIKFTPSGASGANIPAIYTIYVRE